MSTRESASPDNAVQAATQHLLRTLIDSLPDRIYVKDRQSRFLLNNSAHLHALGATSQQDAFGKTDYDFRPVEFAARSHADDQNVMDSGRSLVNYEEPMRLASGETGTLLVSKYPLYGPDGGLIGMYGISRDVTEQKKAEQKLRDSQARIRAITQSTQDAVLMMDPDGRISFWNKAAERIFGYSSTEAIGSNLHQLLAPARYHAAHADAFKTFRQTGAGNVVGTTLELTACHKSGREIAVELSLSAIASPDGWHAAGILRDISQRKQMEQELRQYASKLEETVELRTQDLHAVNQELTALNQTLEAEILIRQQKESDILLREKQYRATTRLLTNADDNTTDLLKSVLHDAVRLVGAPEGYIGYFEEHGANFVVHHEIGAIADFYRTHLMPAVKLEQGLLSQVYRSGDACWERDYRSHPQRIPTPHFNRVASLIIVPLKLGEMVSGALAVVWTDNVHPVTGEDVDVVSQFAALASIALERSFVQEKLNYQNKLLQKLAETTASLVTELDLDKALQNILEQAKSFMGIPHGFIVLFTPDGRHVEVKCGLGRYHSQTGMIRRFNGQGIFGEVQRTGKSVVILDYAHWPQRMVNDFNQEMTAEMQAPLLIDGKTIGTIGLALFGEPIAMDPQKLAVFEQFATVASIAVKNALAHQRTRHQAFHDPLTGLPNRAYLNNQLEAEMKKARCGQASGAVLFIDLDDLKTVNDSFGHSSGDDLIKSAAAQICEAVGPDAFVARVGGDEFIAILPGEKNLRHIADIANQLVSAAQREYLVGGHNIHMSISLGVTLYPIDGDQAEEILKNADNAMYAAKAAGRNCWRFYESAMLKDAYEKLLLTNSLRHALERNEFSLHFQPQIALGSREVLGFEALLRWQSHEHGAVSPARFIPLAEQNGLILPIGEWVFGEACRFAGKLAALGRSHLHVAVNVSPRQLADADFVAMVCRSISDAGIQPAQLEVEITENVLIESLEDSTRKLAALGELGIKLSLDDFGTGYSSLTYLRSLPVATLKIDKTFIDRILEDKVQEGFIGSIIDMAHVLGLHVVAEGVETTQQLEKLVVMDCDCVQGYVFSRPLPEAAALAFTPPNL